MGLGQQANFGPRSESIVTFDPATPVLREVSPLLDTLETLELSDVGQLQVVMYVAQTLQFAQPERESPLPREIIKGLPLTVLNGHLSRPVRLMVEREGDVVAVESQELGLTAFGRNVEEAYEDLAEQVDLAARDYLNIPDSNLTPSGQRLKAALARIVQG